MWVVCVMLQSCVGCVRDVAKLCGLCAGCWKVVWVVCVMLQSCVGCVRDVAKLCGLCAGCCKVVSI